MFQMNSREWNGETGDETGQTACKPGSVLRPHGPMDGHSSGTPVAGRLSRPTRTMARKCAPRQPFGPERPSLFGLAPGGVCHAGPVARTAVRSYRPVSPLPARAPAVCSLWHFPWGRPRRTLSGTVFPWSPDFPPGTRRRRAAVQPSDPGCPICSGR